MVTMEDIARIIKRAKPKSLTGNDILSMRIIKKLYPAIIPHLTHLVNAIILTEIYPTILKVSHISPNIKPDKNSVCIDSYHPISNLSVIDKKIQQYLKYHIVAFFYINNVLHENHHGSHKFHSTVTALAAVNTT